MMVTAEPRKKVVRITTGTQPDEYSKTKLAGLLSRDACLTELERRIHPLGLLCGQCGSGQGIKNGYTQSLFPRHRCKDCGAVYSILSGTPFSGTKLGPCELVVFMRMWHEKAPDTSIAKAVDMHRKTVNTLKQNLILHKKYNMGRG